MRGYIDNHRPTYQELLQGAQPEHAESEDELARGDLQSGGLGLQLLLAVSALLVIGMSVGAVLMLG